MDGLEGETPAGFGQCSYEMEAEEESDTCAIYL